MFKYILKKVLGGGEGREGEGRGLQTNASLQNLNIKAASEIKRSGAN